MFICLANVLSLAWVSCVITSKWVTCQVLVTLVLDFQRLPGLDAFFLIFICTLSKVRSCWVILVFSFLWNIFSKSFQATESVLIQKIPKIARKAVWKTARIGTYCLHSRLSPHCGIQTDGVRRGHGNTAVMWKWQFSSPFVHWNRIILTDFTCNVLLGGKISQCK